MTEITAIGCHTGFVPIQLRGNIGVTYAVTYLFGFRKHEQGNNAVEIPQFDPLVVELETQIQALKQ